MESREPARRRAVICSPPGNPRLAGDRSTASGPGHTCSRRYASSIVDRPLIACRASRSRSIVGGAWRIRSARTPPRQRTASTPPRKPPDERPSTQRSEVENSRCATPPDIRPSSARAARRRAVVHPRDDARLLPRPRPRSRPSRRPGFFTHPVAPRRRASRCVAAQENAITLHGRCWSLLPTLADFLDGRRRVQQQAISVESGGEHADTGHPTQHTPPRGCLLETASRARHRAAPTRRWSSRIGHPLRQARSITLGERAPAPRCFRVGAGIVPSPGLSSLPHWRPAHRLPRSTIQM